MLLLTTTDADGKTSDRMLARFETDGKSTCLPIIGHGVGTIERVTTQRYRHKWTGLPQPTQRCP